MLQERAFDGASRWTISLIFSAAVLLGLCVAQRLSKENTQDSDDDDDDDQEGSSDEDMARNSGDEALAGLGRLVSCPWPEGVSPVHESVVVWTSKDDPAEVMKSVEQHNLKLVVDLTMADDVSLANLSRKFDDVPELRLIKNRGGVAPVEFVGTVVLPHVWASENDDWCVLLEDTDAERGMVFACLAELPRLKQFGDFMCEVMGYETTDTAPNRFKGETMMRTPVFGSRRNQTLCRGKDFLLKLDEKESGIPHMLLVYVPATGPPGVCARL